MEFLDFSLPESRTVVINFPGRPINHHIEKESHLGFHRKYEHVGRALQAQGIGFIGCPQRYHNSEIVGHTGESLEKLTEHIRDKTVILVGSSAGAGGIFVSDIARRIAAGMISLNINPMNVVAEKIEAAIIDFPRWIDFYHGFQDTPGHSRWSERIVGEREGHTCDDRTFSRIDGEHGLTPEQVIASIVNTLRNRGFMK